jgi:hypothetical protein
LNHQRKQTNIHKGEFQMTKNQVQQRSERSQNLKVFQVNKETFYVESSEGKICYRVTFEDEGCECTCGDFSRNSKNDPNFKCKHILAVFNAVPNGEVETAIILKKKRPKLDERFIITIDGKDFVKYPGLLDMGHQKGISNIEVEIAQLPTKENNNFAVCRATVMSKTGDTFIDIGDANPLNCSSKVAKHILRMASTRAIARALRSYTNIGMTCLEELGDLDEVIGENGSRNRKPSIKTFPVKQESPSPQSEPPATEPKAPATDSEGKVTEPEVKPEKQAQQPAKPQVVKPRKVNGKKEPVSKVDSKPDQQPANGNSKKTESKDEEPPTLSTAQKSAIFNLGRRRGISAADLEKMAEQTHGVSVDSLSPQSASLFIRQLQQAA